MGWVSEDNGGYTTNVWGKVEDYTQVKSNKPAPHLNKDKPRSPGRTHKDIIPHSPIKTGLHGQFKPPKPPKDGDNSWGNTDAPASPVKKKDRKPKKKPTARPIVKEEPRPSVDNAPVNARVDNAPVISSVFFRTDEGKFVEVNDPDLLIRIFDNNLAAIVDPQPAAWILSGDGGDQAVAPATEDQVKELKDSGLL